MQRYCLLQGRFCKDDEGEWMWAASVLAILDRPLDDDSNVLLDRCEARKPLSLADQRELFEWFEERGKIIADYDEQIEKLPKPRKVNDGKLERAYAP